MDLWNQFHTLVLNPWPHNVKLPIRSSSNSHDVDSQYWLYLSCISVNYNSFLGWVRPVSWWSKTIMKLQYGSSHSFNDLLNFIILWYSVFFSRKYNLGCVLLQLRMLFCMYMLCTVIMIPFISLCAWKWLTAFKQTFVLSLVWTIRWM